MNVHVPQNDVMFCALWAHLHNLKKREKHPWRNAILLVKLQGFSLDG